MEKSERWVSMEEICNHLGASRDTVKKWLRLKTCLHISLIENGNLKLVKLMSGCIVKIV